MAAEKGLTMEMEILAEKGELEKLLNEAAATGVKGCFCAYDDKPSPAGWVLCNQSPTDPDDTDNLFHGYAIGTLKEHRPAIDRIRERYTQQIRQSHGFDFYDCPGGEVTLERILNLKEDPVFAIMMKLANRAIEEYNEKQDNVFKYKVLKIEKANYMILGYEQYFMTVKVLNLTLVTPIETFYIHVARRIPDRFEEILLCNSKGVKLDVSIFGKKKCWRVVR